MQRIGLAAGLAVGVALAGCGGGGYQIGGPQGGGRGLPAARMVSSPGMVVPPGREAGEALALRAFVQGPDGWQEVTGARCSVTGGEYLGARVVTPVRLVLPDLGPDAPPLTAECTSGTMRGAATVTPSYPWPAETRPSPAQRVWWGGGWWYGFQKSGPLRYPDLAVGMGRAAP